MGRALGGVPMVDAEAAAEFLADWNGMLALLRR